MNGLGSDWDQAGLDWDVEKGLKCMPGIGNVLERISVVFVVQPGLEEGAIAHSGTESPWAVGLVPRSGLGRPAFVSARVPAWS